MDLVSAPAFLTAGSTWLIGIGLVGALAAAVGTIRRELLERPGVDTLEHPADFSIPQRHHELLAELLLKARAGQPEDREAGQPALEMRPDGDRRSLGSAAIRSTRTPSGCCIGSVSHRRTLEPRGRRGAGVPTCGCQQLRGHRGRRLLRTSCDSEDVRGSGRRAGRVVGAPVRGESLVLTSADGARSPRSALDLGRPAAQALSCCPISAGSHRSTATSSCGWPSRDTPPSRSTTMAAPQASARTRRTSRSWSTPRACRGRACRPTWPPRSTISVAPRPAAALRCSHSDSVSAAGCRG